MRTLTALILLLLMPALGAAQDEAVLGPERGLETAFAQLSEHLSAELVEDIRGLVNDATSRGLPGLWVAERALEGVAKGRSGDEARAAAEALVNDLAAAEDAFSQAGRVPDASELEAGATAMSLGVDGKTLSDFARNAERGRPLAVAVAVLGALVDAGLPVGVAYEAVLGRFNDGADNTDLVEMPGEAGRMIAAGFRPSEVGTALGMTVPAGPPSNVPRNSGQPGERPEPPVQPPVQPPAP